ncbi:RNA-directed DNA polymerase [Advenella sp. EE-W14]|uniref:RNA-directed DNA polymerase n=1 Tax=Advenella sp. EE-W14 TaxID=2722705 RepID=UPI00145CDB4E|nr:RNA-directed DNA polymerase [Advenella sp. EE-W14]
MKSTEAKYSTRKSASRQSILELSAEEARAFFLKAESYCSLDLPHYIRFDALIENTHKALEGKALSGLSCKPRDHDDVNYTVLNNKDGKYAWRPFQLIHPALYVSLVHQLTTNPNWELVKERFATFSANSKIHCLSLPVVSLSEEKDKAEQVSQWWHSVEQRSIELSLEYEYLVETDITDCYGAIYTHSIAWALHTKQEAKAKRTNKSLLGNVIDAHIQDMRHGQTNGIPQGSVLMDFIAELVLGFADLALSEKIQSLEIEDYCILRYRDDYRVFINNPQDGERIIKLLTEVTIGLGLKLNPGKTRASDDVVRASIKSDKLAWIFRKHREKSLQKHLLIIHDHATRFPNAGSLVVALNEFHKRISRLKRLLEQPMPMIAIVVDFAYRNPRTYAICAAILSKLMSFLDSEDEKKDVAEKIKTRFAKIPNTGHMQIWIQRATLPIAKEISYQEPICRLVSGEDVSLWSTRWITSADLKRAITTPVIDQPALETLEPVIPIDEVELFLSKETGGYYQ